MNPHAQAEVPDQSSCPETAITSAREATEQGDWVLAERILRNALNETGAPIIHVHLGTLYAHRERHRRAISHWIEYIKTESANDWLVGQIVDACIQCREWDTALQVLEQTHSQAQGISDGWLRRQSFITHTKKRIQNWFRSFPGAHLAIAILKKTAHQTTLLFVRTLERCFPTWVDPNHGPSYFNLGDYMRFVLTHYRSGIDESLVYHKNREAIIASRWLPIEVPGARILDLGTGKSGIPRYWSTLGCDVTALDGSLYGMGEQKERFDLRFCCGDATHLPFADESFDGGSAICMLEHIPEGGDIHVMNEMFRVLKPGGIAVITVETSSHAAENWHEVPYEIGYQDGGSSLGFSSLEEVFCRQYSPADVFDRLIGSCEWDVITDGFYDDGMIPFRRWMDAANPYFFSPFLFPFQPALSLLFFRPTVTYKKLSPSSIGFLVLRKPAPTHRPAR